MIRNLLILSVSFLPLYIYCSCDCLLCTEKGVQKGDCGCGPNEDCGYEDKPGSSCISCVSCWKNGKCGNVAPDGSYDSSVGYLKYYTRNSGGNTAPAPAPPPPPSPGIIQIVPEVDDYNYPKDCEVIRNLHENNWITFKLALKENIIPRYITLFFDLKWEYLTSDPFMTISNNDITTFSLRPVYNDLSGYPIGSWQSITAYRASLNYYENNIDYEIYKDGPKENRLVLEFGENFVKVFDGKDNFNLSHSLSEEYLNAFQNVVIHQNIKNISMINCGSKFENRNCSRNYYWDNSGGSSSRSSKGEDSENLKVVAENYIPVDTVIEFKIEIYKLNKANLDKIISIFNCDENPFVIKLDNNNLQVCLNENCLNERVYISKVYTIRINIQETSILVYTSKEWRNYKLLGSIIHESRSYFSKKSYLEVNENIPGIKLKYVKIESISCDKLPKVIYSENNYCDESSQFYFNRNNSRDNKSDDDSILSIVLKFIEDNLLYVIISSGCLLSMIICNIIYCYVYKTCCCKEKEVVENLSHMPVDVVERNSMYPPPVIISNGNNELSGTL